MKLKNITLLCCGFFTSTSLIAGIIREDIATQDYRDFAENLGEYTVGKRNINVLKTDGTSAGTLDFPMPDFGAVASKGYATLYSPSYVVSVKHNTGYKWVYFGNNANYQTRYMLIGRNNDAEHDFHVPRLNKVVTEAAPVPAVVGKELAANPDRYTWYARVGAGTQRRFNSETQKMERLAGGYEWKSGGTLTHPTFESWRLRWYNHSLDDAKLDIFDSAAQPGDSGSPLFVYDNYDKLWKLVGVTTGILGSAPYDMRTYNLFIQDNFVAKVLAANTDPDVNDIRADGTIKWSKDDITQGENNWAWHGVNKALPTNATNAELDATKDLRFAGEGGTIELGQSVNLGAGKLQFSSNYQVKSSEGENYTWVGGGIEVDADKTVDWQVNGLAGDTLHKIGQGTLHVNAAGINRGGLNVGDGTVILDQQADEQGQKQAFSTITLVSGRPTVVLADQYQIATEKIRFGYRGGTLDINGNSLVFNTILHNDNGAAIVNRNLNSTGAVTLYGDGFNFLGHIGEKDSGKLDLFYDASDSAYRSTLSGGTDVRTLAVKRGELVLSGEQTQHAGNVYFSDDWSERGYKAGNVDIQTGTTLTVSDHASLDGNTIVAENATLNLYAHAFLSGIVALTEADSLLQADITLRDSTVAGLFSTITADIRGAGQLIKMGEGTLSIDGDILTTGDTELKAGTLALNGNVSSAVNMAGNTVLAGAGTLQALNATDRSTIYPGALLMDTPEHATLRVDTLNASGRVNLSLNSAFSRITTDKLLVKGDVKAEEPIQVSINGQSVWHGSDANADGVANNTEGVSIIQVGGKSTKETFKLAGDYVARGARAYGLYAFAPGKSAASEREVSGSGDQYWDYRLQNILLSEEGNAIPVPPEKETIDVIPDETPDVTPDGLPDETETAEEAEAEDQSSRPVRRAVTPQVPSYISLPSALFRAEEQRTALFKERASDASREGRSRFFLTGYRGEENFTSGNSFRQYGYNYKSRYKGWMMGANFATWQEANQSLDVSGAWSKGDMTFTPSAVDGYSKGNFNTDTLNLMASWYVDNYYLNLISGYGWSKGDIVTRLRGNAASPKIRQLYGEIEAGKTFNFGQHRVRPYTGYRTQQIRINRFTDVDSAQVSYQQQRRNTYTGGLAWDYAVPADRLGTLRLGTDVNLAMRPSGQGKVTVSGGQQSDVFRSGKGGNRLNLKTQASLDLNKNITLTTQVRHTRKLQQEGANDWLLAGGFNVSF